MSETLIQETCNLLRRQGLLASAEVIEKLREELELYAGPVCPIDGRRAMEHLGIKSYYHIDSFAEPSPKVPHEYTMCWDCDELSHYDDADEHCATCKEPEGECDKTVMSGGQRPCHPDWPEAAAWWKRYNKFLLTRYER